jgi:hypothetical protein
MMLIFVKMQNSPVHLGTSLRYVHQVPKCHKVVHLGLDPVSIIMLEFPM